VNLHMGCNMVAAFQLGIYTGVKTSHSLPTSVHTHRHT
jgi:hypothetical protein